MSDWEEVRVKAREYGDGRETEKRNRDSTHAIVQSSRGCKSKKNMHSNFSIISRFSDRRETREY